MLAVETRPMGQRTRASAASSNPAAARRERKLAHLLAEPIMPMEHQVWGDRYGQLRDPFGHR